MRAAVARELFQGYKADLPIVKVRKLQACFRVSDEAKRIRIAILIILLEKLLPQRKRR
ncbi:hypothetical protein ES703_45701 [subsurface metagenome]